MVLWQPQEMNPVCVLSLFFYCGGEVQFPGKWHINMVSISLSSPFSSFLCLSPLPLFYWKDRKWEIMQWNNCIIICFYPWTKPRNPFSHLLNPGTQRSKVGLVTLDMEESDKLYINCVGTLPGGSCPPQVQPVVAMLETQPQGVDFLLTGGKASHVSFPCVPCSACSSGVCVISLNTLFGARCGGSCV